MFVCASNGGEYGGSRLLGDSSAGGGEGEWSGVRGVVGR